MFSEKNVSFIYSIVTLFSKTEYYLSRIYYLSWDVCLKWKKEVIATITIIIEYAWICLNKQGSNYTYVPKHAKILNMAGFSIWERSECGRIYFDRVLNTYRVLNMSGF